MSESQKCSECGADLPANAPGGHCLQCLLQLALDLDVQEDSAKPAQPKQPISTEKPGDRIGHYKLLQKIGEGGCGIVYMAEQEEPVRRRVALKIIKLGMDTRQVVARFEAERQALAMMDHPHIAKVFDAGATETPHSVSDHPLPGGRGDGRGEDPAGHPRPSAGSPLPSDERGVRGEGSYLSPGRPFFVMELVRGVKITTYCDQQKLSTRERLELFIQICQAVQHAHQKGIIHRDLKPSNVLVTERDGAAVPKIIDFGIAKATTDQQLTDKTLFTAFEQFLGTPAYMSPEQAGLGALDVDTRSDIYSLGVLLYELLTGNPPFDSEKLRRSALDEVLKTIREQEPPRPSVRLTTLTHEELTTVAQRRQTESARFPALLRGDLDWIVMKCLDKDRGRRYETANGLAMDIERHLNCQPVIARPPSKVYEFQKTVRRHKIGFGAAAALVLVLAAGVVVSTLEAARARRAEQKAEAARASENLLRQRLEYRLQITEARDLFDRGKAEEAKRMLDGIRPELFESGGEQMDVRRLLGWEYAREYLWTNAISNLAGVVHNDSPQWNRQIAIDHYYYSTVLVIANDLAAYDDYRQNLVADLSRTNDLEGSEFLCQLVLLTPADRAFMRSLTPFVDAAREWTAAGDASALRDGKANKDYALALVAYRNGDNAEALTLAADYIAQRAHGQTFFMPRIRALRAMALYRMGQVQEAKQELDLAKQAVDPIFKKGVSRETNKQDEWFWWQIARIYINEAEKMINDPAAPALK